MTNETEDFVRLERHTRATIAALSRAAKTDGREISSPARKGFLAKFETEHRCRLCGTVTIDQSLPPEQKARAVKAAISAHFLRLAKAAAAKRSIIEQMNAATERASEAGAAEEQLHNELGELDDEC